MNLLVQHVLWTAGGAALGSGLASLFAKAASHIYWRLRLRRSARRGQAPVEVHAINTLED